MVSLICQESIRRKGLFVIYRQKFCKTIVFLLLSLLLSFIFLILLMRKNKNSIVGTKTMSSWTVFQGFSLRNVPAPLIKAMMRKAFLIRTANITKAPISLGQNTNATIPTFKTPAGTYVGMESIICYKS